MEQAQVVPVPAPSVEMQEQALLNVRALPLLLAIITFALGLVYLAVIPPWAGPDEPRHYEYVRLMHEKGGLVGYPDIDPQVMNEIIRSMDSVNYWKWGVSLWKRAGTGELPGDFGVIYGEAAHQLHQPPLAYMLYLPVLNALADNSIRTQLYAMRLVSILLNVATVLAAYVAGREVFRKDATMALAVPVFVMLLPQHLFLHSIVMNDHLTEAAFAWMIALVARTFRLGMSPLRVIGIVLLLGIALAAKRSALYGIPILGFAFLVYMFVHWGKQLSARQKSIRFALTVIVFSLAAVGLVWLWQWLAVNQPRFTDYVTRLFLFLPSEQFPWEFDPRMVDPATLPVYLDALKLIFISTWGHFGWLNVQLGVWTYWGFAVLCVLASIGMILYAVRDLPKLEAWQRGILVVFAASLVFAFTLILGIEIRYWTLGWQAGSQGRYLFPVLIPLATLFLLGTRVWLPRARYLVWFGVVVSAMVLYNIIALGFFIIPFYRA